MTTILRFPVKPVDISYADRLVESDHSPSAATRRALEARMEHLLEVARTTFPRRVLASEYPLPGFLVRREQRRRDALAAELRGLRASLRAWRQADRLIAAANDHVEGQWKGWTA